MEVNSVANEIARPVGGCSVIKVTNELEWVTEIGCGDSTNSIWSSIYRFAPIRPKPAAARFIHGERNKVTDGPSEFLEIAVIVIAVLVKTSKLHA
jgi:hypothetical protein